jgi:twitching motility protein PilT
VKHRAKRPSAQGDFSRLAVVQKLPIAAMSEALEVFNSLLQLAVENKASDIHVKSNKAAYLRMHGRLEAVEMDAIMDKQVLNFIDETVPPQFAEEWKKNFQVDYCYSLEDKGLGRFRVSAFYQRNTPSIVFRHIKERAPTFEQLNYEADSLKKLCELNDGIVLVCGATGSGKSSTLAAMINYINQNQDLHIVTLEDPIEYMYTDIKSLINQREVGLDTPSFALGLKSVLRQDPDVILVGEMRDAHTFETAIHAAETGHLVFGTLHAANAQQAVQRLFDFFPPEQQMGMRRTIAGCLRATITQKLVPAMEGGGRVPVVELFIVDMLARNVIQEGQFDKIPAVIDAGGDLGSKSFNKDIYRLIKEGKISKNIGLEVSPNPKALEMNLKGIFLSQGGIVG